MSCRNDEKREGNYNLSVKSFIKMSYLAMFYSYMVSKNVFPWKDKFMSNSKSICW